MPRTRAVSLWLPPESLSASSMAWRSRAFSVVGLRSGATPSRRASVFGAAGESGGLRIHKATGTRHTVLPAAAKRKRLMQGRIDERKISVDGVDCQSLANADNTVAQHMAAESGSKRLLADVLAKRTRAPPSSAHPLQPLA